METKLKRIILFIIIILLNACSVSGEENLDNSLPGQESTSPSQTQVTNTIIKTPVVLPTKTILHREDVETDLISILRNNGKCSLPCFLGIIPGQTRNEEATSILANFDNISMGTEIVINRDDLILSLSVNTQGGYKGHSEIIKWVDVDIAAYRNFQTKSEKIYGSLYYLDYFKYYTLSNLLSVYGPPTNVYVFLDTGIEAMGLGIDLYILHLDYPEQGWVAHLEMPLLRGDNIFIGCPSNAHTHLRLWSPDAPARDYNLESTVLFTIEEATGMTIDEFYQKFKNPASNLCLETSSNIHK